MLECEIRFLSTSYLSFEENNNNTSNNESICTEEDTLEKKFEKFWISGIDHRLNIYQSKSTKDLYCYIIPDHMKLQKIDNKTLKMLHVKNKVETEILEIKSTEDNIKKFQKIVSVRQKFLAFKGPLCFNPSQVNRPSLFSTEEKSANLRGFLNLAFLIVFATNFRMMIENFLNYGLRFQISVVNILWQFQWFIISVSTLIFGFISLAYNIEKLAFYEKISERTSAVLNAINIILCFTLPCIIVQILGPNPFLAVSVLNINMILVLKMISYAHVMRNTRLIGKKILELEKAKKDIYSVIGENEISPDNVEIIRKYATDFRKILKIKDLLYFLCAPTLCFQLFYPRTKSIRKLWLLKRCFELTACLILQAFIAEQYIAPTLESSIDALESGGYLKMFERLLRLSIPSLYGWILGFFAAFQFYFNITAELLQFADREFYQDWWNCHDFNEYWRKWNMPVHHWFIRHVYNPMIKRGYSKTLALFVVFFISALAHEYLVSASLRVWTYWAFISMMVQAPIMFLQKKLDKVIGRSQWGNVGFWISFCFIGQPACLIIYYYEYLILNHQINPQTNPKKNQEKKY